MFFYEISAFQKGLEQSLIFALGKCS